MLHSLEDTYLQGRCWLALVPALRLLSCPAIWSGWTTGRSKNAFSSPQEPGTAWQNVVVIFWCCLQGCFYPFSSLLFPFLLPPGCKNRVPKMIKRTHTFVGNNRAKFVIHYAHFSHCSVFAEVDRNGVT